MNQIAYIVRDLEARGLRLPKLRRSAPPEASEGISGNSASTRVVLPKDAVAERRARIARLWRKGQNSGDIATALNMPVRAVKSDVYQLQCTGELPLRRLDMAEVKARRASVAELCDRGLTAAEIAAELSISVAIVYRDAWILRKRGDLAPVCKAVKAGESCRKREDHSDILALVSAVAAEFQLSTTDILSKSRYQNVVIARQETCLRALDAGHSVSKIARALGRDHSSVLHGINAAAVRRGKAVEE